MSGDNDDSNDFGEAVLPVEISEAAVPLALDQLQPWHHPRKQFVREKQWQLYTRRLVEKLRDQQKLPSGLVKYLTLPGIDFFDVEMLGRVVSELGLKFEATGFLAEAEKAPIRARSQVRAESLIKGGLIEDTSMTFPYRFEDMGNKKSQAYRDVKARAPFDVVNIDACGSIAAPSATQPARIINAIHELMNLQFSVSRKNWLLFVTTDARNGNLSQGVQDALKAAIRENSQASTEFADGAKSLFSEPANTDIDTVLAAAEVSEERFLKFFSLGFSKWILHNANGAQWDMKSRQFYCYGPEATEHPTMACLAYEFSPRPVDMQDPFGAVDTLTAVPTNQTNYSMKALERTQSMLNLDSHLVQNPLVRSNFSARQKTLLVASGYQAAALDEFDALFS
jgi:hypothetical protein